MNRESIREVMREVVGSSHTMLNNGNWVSMPCPLARWRHEKGRDTRPSAGVSVNDNDTSVFNCFTCGTRVPFHHLIELYAGYTGKDLSRLVSEIREEEYLGPTNLESWEAVRDARMEDLLMPIDEHLYMGLYDSAAGHPYLRERGISRATTERLQLLFDPKDPVDGFPRILFPVRGLDGLLYGFSGRDITGKADLKVRDYYGLKKAHMVLGAHLTEGAKDIVVVEGLFDYASIHELGACGCALMHAHATEHQLNILRHIGRKTYAFLDDDKAGREGVTLLCKGLHKNQTVFVPEYPEVWIDDPEDPDGGHWLKDPGELTKEEFDAMRAGAEMFIDEPYKKRYSANTR